MLDEDLDPDRLSFTRTLRVVRRQLIAHAAFPLTRSPSQSKTQSTKSSPSRFHHAGCAFPGAVKRKMQSSSSHRPELPKP